MPIGGIPNIDADQCSLTVFYFVSFFDQSDYDIRCEWGLPGIERTAPAKIVIIVDVLSFSTCVDIAVGRGVTVLPYRWKDETAVAYARTQNAELADRRNRLDGRYSLAPSSLIHAPAGLRLVLPSPNGSTLAFQARDAGAKVVAGCLRNALAMARWANTVGGPINVIPAGELWPDGSLRFAIEDLLGAGAILQTLEGRRSPEAQTAQNAYVGMQDRLHEVILGSISGKELADKGFMQDIAIAAAVDASSVVPLLTADGFVNANPASP